jgi:hypothetical protein
MLFADGHALFVDDPVKFSVDVISHKTINSKNMDSG